MKTTKTILKRAVAAVAVVVGLLITSGTAWGATYFNVRTSGGSYGTPYAYFGVDATAAGGYWEQYRKTGSGVYPGVTGTALTFDTVRYEELHQGCGGDGCHFVAPGVFFGNAPGPIPANQHIRLIDSAEISPTTDALNYDLRVGFMVNPAAFVTKNGGDNGGDLDLFADWGTASGEYFHLEIGKDPSGYWRVSHSGTFFAADGVHEGERANLSGEVSHHDTGVPIGYGLDLNWWLDDTTLHFTAGNTHLIHTDARFITGVPAFFSGRGAWSDGTPTSYQILGKASIVVSGQNSTNSLAYAGVTSATDLINADQATLASADVTPAHWYFPGGGINDGLYNNDGWVANTYFTFDTPNAGDSHFPAVATYQLNLAGAPYGYDLTSIDSFMGWAENDPRQGNQTYNVEVSTVGSSSFRPLAQVNYSPFDIYDMVGTNIIQDPFYYETRVTITEDTTGVLAANVDAIRFIFADPGTAPIGTLVREIDVQGTPSATAPPPVLEVYGQNSTNSLAYAGVTSATDLINAGQATLASADVTPSHPAFTDGRAINDGLYEDEANTFFEAGVDFPATATYQLNLAGAPLGYDLTSIDSFMGWYGNTPRQANQTYTVEVSTVDSSGFLPLVQVNYAPFSTTGSYDYETRVTIQHSTGVLAAKVDAIRFIFADPGTDGDVAGTMVREIDVQGTPSAAAPLTLTIVREGGDVKVSWTDPTAVLQESTDLNEWTNLPDAVSPHVLPASGSQTFWQLRK